VVKINFSADELTATLLSLKDKRRVAILDSCARTLGDSRFLIAGFEPAESFEFYCRTQIEAFRVLDFLDEKLKFYQSKNKAALDFSGACIATLAYDFGLLFENIVPRAKEFSISPQPSAMFMFYETLVVHDYLTKKTFTVGKDAADLADVLNRAKKANPIFSNEKPLRVRSNFTKNEYLAAVEKIKKHIALGDIYQANLTQQLSVETEETLSPEAIFWRLRKTHPAPFAAFLKRENDAVVSASPERFLKLQIPNSKFQNRRIVLAQPIKGTRPRGSAPAEDLRLRRELEQSAKDRAENVMIVDLLRNDVGRVCEFGSVQVEKLCEIEEYASLFHLVSTVSGELRDDVSAGDLLRATFPCGSITGAPKIRAMQILDEIETVGRGLSMGAIGRFGFDGSMDLNVAIRTAVVRENSAFFNVGGGIVADSDPDSEYAETLVKARSLLAACGANF
jgi:para-aminobenzoate synthetase component I